MDSSELEHVQYKFATIIGGLCGKPQILSQFAVWLDLRLAEYKLKGAISLDCSGLKPDPKWLEGIKPDIIDSEQCTGGTDMGRPGEVTLFSQDSSQDASGEVNPVQSPALVIKTEEDAGSVFPVSLHEHSHNAKDLPTSALHSVATRETQSLKRRFQHTGHSLGQKTKRLSSSSEVDLQGVEIVPVNESLMSLIGSTSDSKDNGTNDSVNEYDSGTPFDENSSYTSLLDDSTVVHQAKAVSGMPAVHTTQERGRKRDAVNFKSLSSDCCVGQSVFTTKNTASCVTVFTRWLREQNICDCDRIEQLPQQNLTST
ncbi:uncharacterized protein LOC135464060 isoform X2 [Liolophura sinensis]|uniref:uncharacterized protein LOC135464060 isoform X2 n=1 Tax=Liolophura sinensis TaxID=3198878 RepID=UPI0031594F8C